MSISGSNPSRRVGRSRLMPVSKTAVKQILQSRQESKQMTVSNVVSIPFATAGTVFQLDTIGQGDDINQRSGDTIRINALEFFLSAYEPTAGTSTVFRVMLFSDSMANAAIPAVTDVLDSANFTAPIKGINFQRRRFKVLVDKDFVLCNNTQVQEVPVHVRLPLKITRYYNDTTNGTSGIGKNALFCLVISSGQATCIYQRQWCVRYTDS